MLRSVLALALLTITTQAQLIIPFHNSPPKNQPPTHQQAMASSASDPLLLCDILGTTARQITTFASLARSLDSLNSRLESASINTTILAPSNSALAALGHKPWEKPSDYSELGTEAYAGQDGSARAERNLRRFVEGHVVPVSPWEEGVKVESLGSGKELWWEGREGGKRVVVMGGKKEVGVAGVVGTVKNGEVWVLDGVLE